MEPKSNLDQLVVLADDGEDEQEDQAMLFREAAGAGLETASLSLLERFRDDAVGDESRCHDGIIESLPPQLHPAVSLGLKRVSSCYFSMHSASSEASNSVADLLSLLDEQQQQQEESHNDDEHTSDEDEEIRASSTLPDVLYHDIMMLVFTFLNAKDLSAFSSTARRPNFECFYFFQLQLQRAALVAPTVPMLSDGLDRIAGVGYITRLAAIEERAANEILQEYTNSNTTLTRMPLSHSLAYIRQLLWSNGFQQQQQQVFTNGSSPSNALASAALFITLVGAVSVMSGNSTPETVLPNVLKVGLAGSFLGAARDVALKSECKPPSMRETAEQMARMMQEVQAQFRRPRGSMQQRQQAAAASITTNTTTADGEWFPSSIAARIYTAFTSAYEQQSQEAPSAKRSSRRGKRSRNITTGGVAELEKQSSTTLAVQVHPLTPNPYEHLPTTCKEVEHDDDDDTSPSDASHASTHKDGKHSMAPPRRKMASGCVGAFSRAVHRASSSVTKLLKDERKSNFARLTKEEQQHLATMFIDACSSDDTLTIVKDMIQVRSAIDVDGFYLGSDGAEACALHTAAFHGACRVVEFLCGGVDESSSESDGGLCDVNLRDTNGWTALHFAAGANSVESVRILARHGAKLTVEASNGYTPFHWAQRLSNTEVADELKRLGADQIFPGDSMVSNLSLMASRFFSMIPTR